MSKKTEAEAVPSRFVDLPTALGTAHVIPAQVTDVFGATDNTLVYLASGRMYAVTLPLAEVLAKLA